MTPRTTGLNQESLTKHLVILFLFILSSVVNVVILIRGTDAEVYRIAGTIIVVTSCYTVLYLFLFQFRKEILNVIRKVLFILLTILIFMLAVKIITKLNNDNLIWIVPFAAIPVVIRTFYDARLAIFILVITILLSGLMVSKPLPFILLNFVSGLSAIFTLKSAFGKLRLFLTSAVVVLTSFIIFTGLTLMFEGAVNDKFIPILLLFTINGLLVLISYPVIFLFEQDFLLISENTLMELSDPEHPLLRKLAEDAPGSFQHSLQVANLAEEAARAINANVLLVRAGALCHDIGKVGNPGYFIENQTEGISPHENLDPRKSARIIMNHVRNGVTLAKNYKVPIQVIDFIRTHHGTTTAYFFYKKFIDSNPEGESELNEFTYSGPKPFTRETAVVMMADAVEASSRSLTNFSEESISELVERIIYIQEQDGQFSEVPLTYKDMSDIKSAFKRRISNIFHARIAYPGRG
jgi:hypothetical protein